MKRLLCLVLALTSLFPNTARAASDAHVILITIDGFPARMLNDPKASLPRIRELAAEGATARAMKVSNPSITWPNHTTLVSGVRPAKHSVLFNGVLDRGDFVKVNSETTAAELVAVPTIFDMLHNAGYKTAGINWPCTRGSKSLDDDIPDSPRTMLFTTPRFRSDLVSAGILKSEDQKDFAHIDQPEHDEIWTRAASYLIRKRMPNFMAVHLLNTDGTHHKYAPETPASYTALALADRFVGDIIDAVKAAGHRDKTTFIVTADHGFATVTNVLHPNALLRQAGLLEVSSNIVAKARVQVISEGGSGFVYFINQATRAEDSKKVIELFAGKEGIVEIIRPEKFASLGMPEAGHGGMADLILRPKMGFGISNLATGDEWVTKVPTGVAGYHGYISDEFEMNAPFIASGRNIQRGVKVGAIENVDVAPTIMRLLGQSLPTSDGLVLDQILK